MVLLAFSLQDQVEKYGAYVGLAAFFGLAVLSLLYFAQAREVKRLREWAGRAPERAAELELAVAAHAEQARRAPAPAPAQAPPPVSAPLPAPVGATANGAVKLKPEEVAALAFARAAGVHAPHEPAPQHVPAAAVAAAPAAKVVAAVGEGEPALAPAAEVAAAVGEGEPALAPATNGVGGVPAPATPAARRADQAAAPAPPAGGAEPPAPATPPVHRADPSRPLPRRHLSTPPRRTPASAPLRESGARAVVVTAVIGVLVLAGAVFAATRLVGGGNDQPKKPNVVPTATDVVAQVTATPAPPAPTKATVKIGVYNGTGSTGLAAQFRDQLVTGGYPVGNLGVDTAPPAQKRVTSVVMYRRGARAAAQGASTALDIPAVQPLDAATQALAARAKTTWDVVVIVGADKSP